MAKNKSDLCLLCGESPCACEGPPKKKSSPRAKKASAPSTTPTEPAQEDVFSDAVIPTREAKFKVAPKARPPRDLVWESALRALRPIVHRRDRNWIDTQLPDNPAADRQLHQWKERHADRKKASGSE